MKRSVLGASISLGILAGCGAAATPGSTPSLGGTVQFQLDGAAATTDVDLVAAGASVSGTAVTTVGGGEHSVRLECAARYGDVWALGGTVEQSTVETDSAGARSAVIIREGTPQGVLLWMSDPESGGMSCRAWLDSLDAAGIGPENFEPVESGALVPPV